jgi:hypothetical protein
MITSAMARTASVTGRIAGEIWLVNEFKDSGGEKRVHYSRVSGKRFNPRFLAVEVGCPDQGNSVVSKLGGTAAQGESDGPIEKRLVPRLWVRHNSCTPSGKTAALPIDS